MTKEVYMFVFQSLIKNSICSLMLVMTNIMFAYITTDLLIKNKSKYINHAYFLYALALSVMVAAAIDDFHNLIDFRVHGKIANQTIIVEK